MDVYIIRNGINDSIIEICDEENNANQLKDNLIMVGEYKKLYIEKYEVDSNNVVPLQVVKITGNYTKKTIKVSAYNPAKTMTDKLEFTVTGNEVTFEGYVNLTSEEQANFDLDTFKTRVKTWVSDEFKTRLENDN